MWETFKKIFENQSALANFLQIGGAVVAILALIRRVIKWASQRIQDNRLKTLSLWLTGKSLQWSSAKSLRIAVVDDHPDAYPLESLRRLGYSVVHLPSLGLSDIPQLLDYQCVLLDINGVLVEDPKRGGLEILKRLKTPDDPYVVAVSSKGFEITMSEFFMLADQRLKKPIPQPEVEGIIESAYEARYSAEAAAHRVDSAASFGTTDTRCSHTALRKTVEFIEGQCDEEAIRIVLSQIVPKDLVPGVLRDLKVIKRSLIQVPR